MQLRETDYWKKREITASQQHTGEFFPRPEPRFH